MMRDKKTVGIGAKGQAETLEQLWRPIPGEAIRQPGKLRLEMVFQASANS